MAAGAPDGWTLATLEKYISIRLGAMQALADEREQRNKERFENAKESVENALAAADKATAKAEHAADTRFEGVNEFRKTLSDQANMLMPRAEYSAQHQSVVDKVDGLTARVAAVEAGNKGKADGIGWIGQIALGAISFGSLLVALVTAAVLFFRH